MKNITIPVLFLMLHFYGYCQLDSIPLEKVIINNFAIPQLQKDAIDAISIIDSETIAQGNSIEFATVLNQVPGVFMQNGTLNTNRITIRGIGARNLFGTANIRTYIGEIPLTDGNGESTIEDLELASLSHIEIHKGPSSSSFGVGLGGAIILHPKLSTNKKVKGSIQSSFGSYNFSKYLATIAFGNKHSNTTIVASTNHLDGYRDNNQYDRQNIVINSSVRLTEKDSLDFLGNYVKLKAGIPSSLDQEDFENNPSQAAFTWGSARAFEDMNYGILGVTWKHKFNQKTSKNTSVFGSLRKNEEPRPFNILNENSNGFGIRSRVIGQSGINNSTLHWNLGAEVFYEYYRSKTFENLYQDFPPGNGSVQGAQLSELDEKRYYYNLFAEANFVLNKKLRIHAGVHTNQTFFDIKDKFLLDNDDSSGEFKFDLIFSPKLGFNYAVNYHMVLFGNISHGFSTPTTTETLLPDGIFNPDIKPETGWNFELGTRYKLLNSLLYGSATIYSLNISNLLVTRRTIDDNFFAINAGKTIHNGIEAEINYDIIKSDNSKLLLFANSSIYDYEFKEFVDGENNFSGNDLTGVPSMVSNIGIRLSSSKGLYGTLTFQYVDKIAANDENTVFSDSYNLLNGKLGYKNHLGKHLLYDVFLGANNITDTQYASQLQINASSFGNNAPRYFYPGLPFNMYGGININYRL